MQLNSLSSEPPGKINWILISAPNILPLLIDYSRTDFGVPGNFGTRESGFPGGSVVKNFPANAGDMGLIPGLGRSPGEGNGNTLQHSCLENPRERGVWQAAVHGVTRVRYD